MNKLIYILAILSLLSCKTKSLAQEKEDIKVEKEKGVKPKLKIPGFGDPSDNKKTHLDIDTIRLEPNTIHLVGSVESLSKDGVICGTSYKVIALVKIDQIISSGSGLVNLLSAGQEVTLAFMNNAPDSDYETLKKRFPEGNKVSLKVREGLCPDMTQTVYKIIAYTIKN